MNKKLLSLLFLLVSPQLNATINHIFIDINLLVDTSSSAASKEIGTWNATKYLARMGKIPNKSDFFKSLKKCTALSHQQTYNEDLLMPSILSDWLLGLESNSVIKSKIFKHLDKSSLHDIEKTVFKNISNMMLSPKVFIDTQYFRKDIAKIIQNLNKNKLYTIHFIGNWDKESEPLLIKMLQSQSVGTAQQCIFSNKLKQIKPHPEYYDALLGYTNYEPSDCLVIDVEKTHPKGATDSGMKSILIKNYSAQQLKTNLLQHSIHC